MTDWGAEPEILWIPDELPAVMAPSAEEFYARMEALARVARKYPGWAEES